MDQVIQDKVFMVTTYLFNAMIVFTAGTFDVLHVGHINLLLFCRQLAGPTGWVYVSIDSDDKIRYDKGEHRPVFDFKSRRDALEFLTLYGNPLINKVYEHDENRMLKQIIDSLRPDYIVVGSDYKGKEVIGDNGHNVVYYNRENPYSSSKIIKACRK